jgi:hypothetical protein
VKERLIAAAILGVCVLFGAAILSGPSVAKFGTGPDWVTIETPEAKPPAAPLPTLHGEAIPPPPAADAATGAPFESYQPNRSAEATTATLNALAARVTKLELDVAALGIRSTPTPTTSYSPSSYTPPVYTPTVTTVYETPTVTYSDGWPSSAPVAKFGNSVCTGGTCRQTTATPVVRRTFFRRY